MANTRKLEQIEIVEYSEDLKDYIRMLNYEWLEKHFRVEPGDVIALSNPQEEIIDNGGFIFYVKMGTQIIATASLLKKTHLTFELGKMAVTDTAQGLGIGTMLMEHCINFARSKAVEKLVLYSNTKLASAIHLYKKYGFHEVELEEGLYERANIKMEKYL